MARRLRATLVCLLLVLPACPPSAPDSSGDGGDDVGNGGGEAGSLTGELVYFSGRPAPEWTIPEADYAELARRLVNLAVVAEPADFPRFGPVAYRIVNSSAVAGFPDEVLVQEGVIETRQGDAYSYFADDQGLEQALRTSAENDGVFVELGLDGSGFRRTKEVSHD